jgi:molybdopterin-guanine dinucleotide biosynthesis protein A/predicted N-acetyltransferase YhbS
LATGGLTGILLVGGASRRFGSPKALARLDGETLAERAWTLLGQMCDQRLAIGKAADPLELPFPVHDDGSDVRAALAGLVAGLRKAETARALVLPVDTPLVGVRSLRALADGGGEVCISQTGPLPGAYERSALPVLERRLAAGRLALHEALAELETVVVELDAHEFANVNAPAELERLAITIVPFESRYADGWRDLVEETLREFGFQPDPGLDPDLAAPADVYRLVWVALQNQQVVGSIALRDLGDSTFELKRMYARRAVRGRGLGRRLLATALDAARDDGATKVVLDTTERMEAARKLYEAHGFRRVPGEAPRQGQRRLLYELQLAR